MSRGNSGEAIVRNDIDRRAFVGRLGEAIARHRWQCLAYCLLDTHFHLIVRTTEPNLGDGMRWFKSRHAQDVNFRHGRAGHLFGGRFRSYPIETDEYLITAVLYVFLNPVRAGLGRAPEVWFWSSYPATVGLRRGPSSLDTDGVLELFGPERRLARARLRRVVDETLRFDRERHQGSDPGV